MMKIFAGRIILCFTLAIGLFTQGFSQKTAILCKTLIDGTGKTISDAAIIVEGTRIVSIEKKTSIPKGATIVDLGTYTVLPGMIDAHAHPLISADDYQNVHLRGSSASKALAGLKRCQEL